jgi:hypothetical protein
MEIRLLLLSQENVLHESSRSAITMSCEMLPACAGNCALANACRNARFGLLSTRIETSRCPIRSMRSDAHLAQDDYLGLKESID